MSAVTSEQQAFIKEGVLGAGVQLNVAVAGNPITIAGLAGHTITFPISADTGKQLKVFLRVVVEDAP